MGIHSLPIIHYPLFIINMLHLKKVHHIAIICSNYEQSKAFYTDVLGLQIITEVFRSERQSYKLDLSLNGIYVIELFSFPNPPPRLSRPEGTGLRHIAFEVNDIAQAVKALEDKNITVEPIRIDETIGKQFTFLSDPDNLPIELYQV